jgi:hypothetical protein
LPTITQAPTEELCDFVEKYRLSYDLLIGGNLKGLHRMTQQRTAGKLMVSTTVEAE